VSMGPEIHDYEESDMSTANPAADVARERARLARAARTARARAIRRRVVAGALALFVAAWLVIGVVLVTGHDPALSTQTARASSAGSSQTITSSSSSDSSGSSGLSSSGTGSSSSSQNNASSAPLTTRSS
jgi:uncharacterized membrane protein YgcG